MNNSNCDLSVVRSVATTRFNTESIIDLPQSSYANANAIANFQTNVLPQAHHVNAQVQAKSSFWKLFKKNSLKKLFCIDCSTITPQDVRVEELTQSYDIMDSFDYGQAFSQAGATFNHALVDGINQYYIIFGETIYSVNPDLITLFI